MDEKLEGRLVKRYPTLYRDYKGDMQKTCMAWGMACGDGWYILLDNLSSELTSLGKKYNLEIVADQVKEKFGGLRFYYHVEGHFSWYQKRFGWFQTFIFKFIHPKAYWKIIDFRKKIWRTPGEKVQHAIQHAESLSYKTCEVCGKPGKTKGGGWVSTLCNECRDKRK